MSELTGTYDCPICGVGKPHSHTETEQVAYYADQVRADGWASAPLIPRKDGYYLISDFIYHKGGGIWAFDDALKYRLSRYADAPEVGRWNARDRTFCLLYMPMVDNRFEARRENIVVAPRFWREIPQNPSPNWSLF